MNADKLLKALQEIDLCTVQARLAYNVGRKTKQRQVDFLLNSLEQIRWVAVDVINSVEGV